MTKVTAQLSVSVDGFYAGPRFDGNGDWMDSTESAKFFRVTRWATEAAAWRERLGFAGGEQDTNSEVIAESFGAAGAYVMGRRMADGGEIPWGEEPPFRAPVFVVTHRPRQRLLKGGGTSFTYVTDGVASAVEQARAVAGGKDVAVAGAAAWYGRCSRPACSTSWSCTSYLSCSAPACGSSTRTSTWATGRESS